MTWKIAGINFDHFHMGDNLRFAFDHPECEIVGISDLHPERMESAIQNFGIPADRVFTDDVKCLETTKPDLVILCPATAEHARWTKRIAPFDVHILMEKPFAATLGEADEMIEAMAGTGRQLAINWPLAWYPSHRTAKRMIDEGKIGTVIEVHFYDGNRGPLWHGADKIEVTPEEVERQKADSWFYQKSAGGGSLLDYLGYGTTLGTWLMDGQKPVEVTATTHQPAGLEVDEHSIVVARYESGLSRFETRWGTFTDPWTHQPQPKCGFVIVGNQGTISSYDYESTIQIQHREAPQGEVVPVDDLSFENSNPIAFLIDALKRGQPVSGPLSTGISRIGQQIVDTAVQSAQEKKTLALLDRQSIPFGTGSTSKSL